MASDLSKRNLAEFEEGSSAWKRPALDNNAVPRPPTDEGSDAGSIFETCNDELVDEYTPLCNHCQYVCSNWSKGLQDRKFVFPHYSDVFQLEQSVAAGCTMCAQFLQSENNDEVQNAKDEMRQQSSTDFDTTVSFSILKHPLSELALLELKFLRHLSPDMDDLEDDLTREIITFRVDMIPTSGLGPMRDLDDHLKQNTRCALPTVSRWLKNCRKAHWQCNFRHERFTPSRLVSTDENCMRLILRDELQSTPEYATLSHCWAQMKIVTLSTHSFDAFRKRIPEQALSQTFKDAIVTARELGLLYIWIDSLCILQDDSSDWLREAAGMSSVYGGSSLNIAASGAPDGSFGCFLRPKHSLQCQIHVETSGGAVRYRCIPQNMYYYSLANMPLMKRGWTLQERLLPCRTVHFTSTQVFWECYQKVACETFPEEFPLPLVYTGIYLQKQPVSRSMWSWIVERYTSSELTYAADKLIAISGLAREIQMQTRDQYVAGMWRKDLEYQLCWYNLVGQECKRVVPYRAPTWSWASLDCLINCSNAERLWDTRAKNFLWVQILDVQLKFAGTDNLGQLSSANLRLSCSHLLHATFRFESYKQILVAEEKIRAAIFLDDETGAFRPFEAIALPVFGSSDSGRILGLILKPTKQRNGQYERLGVFSLPNREYCTAFEAASEERACWVKSPEGVEIRKDRTGNPHRIISLI